MKRKQLLMSVAAVAICAATLFNPATASAQQAEVGSIAYLPPIALTDVEPAAGDGARAPENNRRHWARYFEYEHRENCQHYVEPPAGWKYQGCSLVRIVQQVATLPPAITQIEPAAGGAVIGTYDQRSHMVYFNFDRDEIRPSEQGKIDAAAQDILQSRPSTVTISGHADAAGPNDYNIGLSERRAQSVANALVAHGVQPDIIEKKAFGEEQLAVPTPDGQPLQANRRTSIEFVPTQPPAGTYNGPTM